MMMMVVWCLMLIEKEKFDIFEELIAICFFVCLVFVFYELLCVLNVFVWIFFCSNVAKWNGYAIKKRKHRVIYVNGNGKWREWAKINRDIIRRFYTNQHGIEEKFAVSFSSFLSVTIARTRNTTKGTRAKITANNSEISMGFLIEVRLFIKFA